MATQFTPPQDPEHTPVQKRAVKREEALAYHEAGRPGKIEVVATKPCATARDLSLAYTPGVAEPCLAIEKEPELSYRYTARGNLVAVISNGTAVLGLGDIGAAGRQAGHGGQGRPLQEVRRHRRVRHRGGREGRRPLLPGGAGALEPTFGGINLEDIKAPECFLIEGRLKKEMKIPVFHDDQHGTAIISGAALLNAAGAGREEDRGRQGGGLGRGRRGHLLHPVLPEPRRPARERGHGRHQGRRSSRGRTEGMNEWKAEFASDTKARTLAEAMVGADVFLGCSVKGMVTPGHGPVHGQGPHRLRPGQPRPGDHLPRGASRRAPDVIMATGPLRLPEPGEQRPRASPTSSAAPSTCGPPPSPRR